MKPAKTTLIAALIASVLIAYTPATRAEDTKESKPAPKGEGRPGRPGGPEGAKERMDKINEELKLTDEQKPKVEAAMKEMGETMRTVRSDSSLSDDQKREKMKTAREALDKKMKAVLTAEQYTKWESMPRPGRPGGQGGPGRPGGEKGNGAKPEKN
jgi:protein CpxP